MTILGRPRSWGGCSSNTGQEYRMAEIIILAERCKARQERRATNVMAMPLALMAAYMAFGAATYAAIVEASMMVFPIRVKLANVMAVQGPHDSDAREHHRSARLRDQDQGLHCCLPLRSIVLGLRKL